MARTLTAVAVAEILHSSPRTIRRRAVAHGIGKVIGSQRLFTQADADRLRMLVRPKAGNPLMGPRQPWTNSE